MRKTGGLLRGVLRWPFTIVGLATLGLWVLVAVGMGESPSVIVTLLMPMYIMRLVIVSAEMALFAGSPPEAIDLLTMPLLLTPYVVFDMGLRGLLGVVGRTNNQPSSATGEMTVRPHEEHNGTDV